MRPARLPKKPAGHGRHEVEPETDENVPGEQRIQEENPIALQDPGAHGTQPPEESDDNTEPAGQELLNLTRIIRSVINFNFIKEFVTNTKKRRKV